MKAALESGFLDETKFPHLLKLQEHWRDIRKEMEAASNQAFILPNMQTELMSEGSTWRKLSLFAWGLHVEKNLELFPITAKLLDEIPDIMQAAFYILGPNSHIMPHTGVTEKVYRSHVGLICPEGCALRVGEETREYQDGTLIVFDDMIEHEAWNRHPTDERFVLHIDFFRGDVEHQEAVETMKEIRMTIAKTYPNLLPQILAVGIHPDAEVRSWFLEHHIHLQAEHYTPEQWAAYQAWLEGANDAGA